MKKLFIIILGVAFFLLFSYFLIFQYIQYNENKANLYIELGNNSYIKDSVKFNVYINDTLFISCQKDQPYSDLIGVKTSWGKHKITVVIDDGLMQRDFKVNVLLVQYCMILFGDKYNEETGDFEEFELNIVKYSIIFKRLLNVNNVIKIRKNRTEP